MRKKLVLSLVLSSLLVDKISASVNPPDNECFFDQDKKLVDEFGGLTVQDCSVIGDNGCEGSRDPDFQPGSEKDKFELSIGLGTKNSIAIMVLNVTISNISFHKLTIKHHNLASKNGEIHCQTIELKKDRIPQKLSVFSSTYELHRTKIQFFAEGNGNKFFKEYQFIPNSVFDEHKDSPIFAYVDTTLEDKVYLHVQPHIDITGYKVKFQPANERIETLCGQQTVNLSVDYFPYLQINFPQNGNYKFCLVPVDNNGTNYSAISTAPFCMKQSIKTMLVQILGFGTIPVSIFLISYLIYIVFRKKVLEWLKERRPNCLLVYSATHDAHIDVMIKLAEYLSECEINAMIDVLDIPYEDHKNPSHWMNSAFEKAHTVVVVASPECKGTIVTKTIYKSLDTHAMKLIHENRRHWNKRYVAVQLPYCKKSDVPKEARALRLLKLPKDLKVLVNKIHHTKYTEVYKIPHERKLIECLESASKSILSEESIAKPKSLENLTDFMFSNTNETAIDVDENNKSNEDIAVSVVQESSAEKTEYATNIETLDL